MFRLRDFFRTHTPNRFLIVVVFSISFAVVIFFAIIYENYTLSTYETLNSNDVAVIGKLKNKKGYTQPYTHVEKTISHDEKLFALIAPQFAIDSIIDSAIIYYELGKASEEQFKYQEALSYFGKALALDKENADYLNAVGTIQNELGEYDKAIINFEKALANNKNKLNENNPKIAICYYELGSAYHRYKLYDKATENYKYVLAINIINYEVKHKSIGIINNRLGNIYNTKGEYDKALAYYEKALAISEITLGKEHPTTKTNAENLTNLKSQQKP